MRRLEGWNRGCLNVSVDKESWTDLRTDLIEIYHPLNLDLAPAKEDRGENQHPHMRS